VRDMGLAGAATTENMQHTQIYVSLAMDGPDNVSNIDKQTIKEECYES